MEYRLLEVAFSALMHDIGKFYQRTKLKSDLSEDELRLTPVSKVADFHTHLHSGYTSRFFKEYLKINSECEMLTSSHHLQNEDEFAELIRKADRIASAIDRNDEQFDYSEKNSKGVFQQIRMSSILGKIDFGKDAEEGIFSLNPFSKLSYPDTMYESKPKEEAIKEYRDLFELFVAELRNDENFSGEIDQYMYERLFALLYEYTTTVPASTYEGNITYVSLFDHLKLTSAIASCLYLSDDKSDEQFCMLEFDMSGIQKFIFKITEGKDTKRDIAKSLRGRSIFVSLITDLITYSYLNEFGLTQSNIMFNTGGGALLLLPCCEGYVDKIEKVTSILTNSLHKLFGMDLTFVKAYITCNAKELELFKVEKAIDLKREIENEKSRKMNHLLQATLFYTEAEMKNICKMCGNNFADDEGICRICQTIKEISEFFVKHDDLYIIFDFNEKMETSNEKDVVEINIGGNRIYLVSGNDYGKIRGKYDYIETINKSHLGITRFIAKSVPLKNKKIYTFEEISETLISEDYGDQKLGVLKMDVDNLGAVFAFGLDKTRSISKFLTLSRLIEAFFGKHLVDICKSVSKEINPEIAKQSDTESLFYINYAGGDDLVIIGPIAAILLLSNEIYAKFKKYTLNENITISAGIFIQSPKAPIRFGIQKAEGNLSLSKTAGGKNSITLLDTTCHFGQFEEVLKRVDDFKRIINEEVLSRSVFYNLMKVLSESDYENYLKSVPKIFYSLKRNVRSDVKRAELVKIFSAIKNSNELSILVLEMKLAIMQTRG